MKTIRLLGLLGLTVLATTACSDSAAVAVDARLPDAPLADAAVPDAGAPDAGAPACVANPTTNDEIINACTTVQGIDKTPVLPLLNADGTLPPLP